MSRRDEERRRTDYELDLNKQKYLAAEIEKQKDTELRIKENELEMMKLKLASGVPVDIKPEKSSSLGLRPKIPKFEEEKDDMDAYIERFERFAKSQKWQEETWAISLSSLLTGKGLVVYTSMPMDQALDYKALKTALLKRYNLTEEGFRTKFRESKPDQGETVFQFVARLDRYFCRWTEM